MPKPKSRMGKQPLTWSDDALENYQRARSGPVTVIKPDGTTSTVSAWAWEFSKRRRTKQRKTHSKSTRSAA